MSEAQAEKGTPSTLKQFLRELYEGDTQRGRWFRYGLLAFDVGVVLFFVVSSMFPPSPWLLAVDYVLAAVLAVELSASVYAERRPWARLREFTTIADVLVILSLVAASVMENLAFLRVVRMLRLLRSYHLLKELRRNSLWFRRNESILESSLNLFIFVYVVTAIVFVLEHERNTEINTFFDALYFTVTTLTTTGFGDITLSDTWGRILAVIIMVFGVALFLRLIQTIFRPPKVYFPCPDCGLSRHEPDAIHCKHCGRTVNIPTEGHWG